MLAQFFPPFNNGIYGVCCWSLKDVLRDAHHLSLGESRRKREGSALSWSGRSHTTREGMAKGLRLATDATGASVDARFDLVLTYDYENLSTSIQGTARQLSKQLKEVGPHAQDDKRLTLLVHSMGGLVSRWFIEQEGGNRVVDHLVMCGTPNVGSPFGKIDSARNLTSVFTTWAMNSFPAFAPFGAGLLAVLGRSKKISPSLEQWNRVRGGGALGIRPAGIDRRP
jgi:pimeloyl-ACP methyl ester carboxylesterase